MAIVKGYSKLRKYLRCDWETLYQYIHVFGMPISVDGRAYWAESVVLDEWMRRRVIDEFEEWRKKLERAHIESGWIVGESGVEYKAYVGCSARIYQHSRRYRPSMPIRLTDRKSSQARGVKEWHSPTNHPGTARLSQLKNMPRYDSGKRVPRKFT